MRLLVVILLLGITVQNVRAENMTPYSGTVIVKTSQAFADYVKNLKAAISANKLGIVAEACATCGARNIGVTIPGNRVIMVFAPNYAVRMLKASVASGIEAPLRLYVTEQADGTAILTYRLPSQVFAPYQVEALDQMASELDQKFARIVAAAGS